jgi:hypothetical protein
MSEISPFDYILCCKALALYLFSIVLVDYASAVPHLSSNVPFPVHEFNELFHFHAQLHNRNA